MVKQKNHTGRNASFKAHRNGIKGPKRQRCRSRRGVCPKFLRNQRHVLKGNMKAAREAKEKK